jgi:TatA/E family protein of Tat protein translocase
MGIENPVHLLFIAVIALIVLGPRRLPELTRAVGRGVREFREAIGQQGSPPQDVLVESPVEEELATHDVTTEDEPVAAAVREQAAPAAAASAGETVDAEVDPAQPVRSGDAPDRRPL